MIVETGAFCLTLAFIFSLAQAGLSFAGRMRRSPGLAAAGEGVQVGWGPFSTEGNAQQAIGELVRGLSILASVTDLLASGQSIHELPAE